MGQGYQAYFNQYFFFATQASAAEASVLFPVAKYRLYIVYVSFSYSFLHGYITIELFIIFVIS